MTNYHLTFPDGTHYVDEGTDYWPMGVAKAIASNLAKKTQRTITLKRAYVANETKADKSYNVSLAKRTEAKVESYNVSLAKRTEAKVESYNVSLDKADKAKERTTQYDSIVETVKGFKGVHLKEELLAAGLIIGSDSAASKRERLTQHLLKKAGLL